MWYVLLSIIFYFMVRVHAEHAAFSCFFLCKKRNAGFLDLLAAKQSTLSLVVFFSGGKTPTVLIHATCLAVSYIHWIQFFKSCKIVATLEHKENINLVRMARLTSALNCANINAGTCGVESRIQGLDNTKDQKTAVMREFLSAKIIDSLKLFRLKHRFISFPECAVKFWVPAFR